MNKWHSCDWTREPTWLLLTAEVTSTITSLTFLCKKNQKKCNRFHRLLPLMTLPSSQAALGFSFPLTLQLCRWRRLTPASRRRPLAVTSCRAHYHLPTPPPSNFLPSCRFRTTFIVSPRPNSVTSPLETRCGSKNKRSIEQQKLKYK